MSKENVFGFLSKVGDLIIKDEKGNSYVDEDTLNYRFPSDQDKKIIISILNKYGIKVRKDVTVKSDRSPLVRDMNYGNFQANGIIDRDIPVMTEIDTNKNGDLIFENYEELEDYLENDFLPKNVLMKKKEKQKILQRDCTLLFN